MELIKNLNAINVFKARARELVSQMTLEEKVMQTVNNTPAIKRLGIKAYDWSNEALHGVARAGTATVFPQVIGLAASFDENLMEEIGDAVSTEARGKYNMQQFYNDTDTYKGLTFWAPNVNIFRDPRWGRGHETFGEDPYLTAHMGEKFIEGIQGDDEKFLKAAACVKHMAVHSGPEALRHEFDAQVSEKDLWETYLPAFEYCVKEGQVEGAMGGYSSLNGTPLCGNKRLITDILREDWGFEGYYVSDCWALRDFHEHHMVTTSPEESAAMAMKAGCDVNCGSCYNQLMKAYYQGMVTEEEIHTSAVRALTTRILLGMNQETPWDQLDFQDVDTPDAASLNYRAAAEGMVLLKNDGILPLDQKKTHSIGVIGPNADSSVVLQGNYHGTASHFVTVMEGMRKAFPDTRLYYASGSDVVNPRTERLAREYDRVSESCVVARASDVVVLCVGLDERYEGEAHHISTGECIGGDKEDLHFPETQRKLIDAVLDCGTPVVLCCMAGSCMDLSPYADRAAAVIQTWYPGAEGGQVLADILAGKTAPSGKLPVTFYGGDYEIPDFTDYSLKNRTYRYVEQGVLYPFGYGLTYGTAEVISAAYDQKSKKVSYEIVNRSDRAVEETVQVYKKNCTSKWEVRNTVLCGFAKVCLAPGETRQGEIQLDEYAFTVVNDQGKRVQDGSDYLLYVGTHGPDKRSEELTGTKTIALDIKF